MEGDNAVHESSYVDNNGYCDGTKIWHYCHIQSGAKIGQLFLGSKCKYRQ